MKTRTSFFITVIASVLFAACSQNELSPGSGSDAEGRNLTTITLGADGENPYTATVQEQTARMASQTRGTIFGDNDTVVETIPDMGVFCLAREVQGTNPEATQISNITDWFKNTFSFDSCKVDNTAEQNDMFCLIYNLKSTRTTKEIKAKRGKAYAITWDKDTVAYYPTTQFYNYDFYAYFPYTERLRHITNTKSQKHRVEAYVTIDGKTDVLWGRATVTDEMNDWEKKYAYSAHYFREPDSASITTNPVISLQHALSRFKFRITPGATIDGGTDLSESKQMKVEKIAIKNVRIHKWLNVADLDNLGMAMESRWQNADGVTDNLVLMNLEDTIATYDLSKKENLSMQDTIQVGDGLIIPPATSYQIQVILSRWEKRTKYVEDEFGTPQPVVVDSLIKYVSETPLVMKGGTDGFKSGKSYDIVITIHGPKQVGVGACLKEWEDVKGPSFEL